MFQRKSNKRHIHCFGKYLPTPLKCLRETFLYTLYLLIYIHIEALNKHNLVYIYIYVRTEAEFGFKTVHHLFSTCGALQSYDILILSWHIRVRMENYNF